MGYGNHVSLDIYNIGRGQKVCSLYDSNVEQEGSAHDVQRIQEMNGWKELSFTLPMKVNGEENWRAQYITPEYEIRVIDGDETDWYRLTAPTDVDDGVKKEFTVNCPHSSVVLKKRNVSLEFDDDNGIGTLQTLVTRALDGSGWALGTIDHFYETGTSQEKIRTYTCSEGTGTYTMIQELCDKFCAYPVFHGDTNTVDILNRENHVGMLEMTLQKNLSKLSRTLDSSDLITRLYVKGEYGDLGYVGIDDVNPTGLNFLLNFDYYREIGALTSAQEAALSTYISTMGTLKTQIETLGATNQTNITALTQKWGSQKYIIYPVSGGAYGTPMYGNGATAEDAMAVGDTVASVKSTGEYTYRTLSALTPASGENWAIKFVPICTGALAGKEDAVTAKDQTIAILTEKYNAATPGSAEQQAYADQIAATQADKVTLQTQQYALMLECITLAGTIDTTTASIVSKQNDMATAEQTFATAMGDLLQDGTYEDTSFAPGQEQALYNDSVALLESMSRPQRTYSLDEIDLANVPGYTDEIFTMNMQAHFVNDMVNDYGFVSKITEYLDRANTRKVDIQTDILNIQPKSFGSLLSRITDMAQVIKDKQTIFERARAIGADGTFGTNKLNGIMDVLQNKLMSTATTWYTDDRGNMIFESADGTNAMMLSGNGFMVANGRDQQTGDWNWRTFGTGEGFTADLMTAGVLQAGLITILGSDQFYWTEDNIYVVDPNDEDKQIRIGRYDGTNLGIAYTQDGGTTWQTAIGFDGIHLSASEISLIVSNVKIGGRNLFIGTQDFSNTNSQWTRLNTGWTVSSSTYGGCKIASKSVYWNCMSQKVTVEAGETYTWSAWMKAASTQQIRFLAYREETTGHCTVDSYPSGIFATIGTEWKRVAFTVKIENGGIAEPGADVQNNGVAWYICGIKFERGNVATDWSLAPEDINSDFESVRTELSLVPGRITAAVEAVKIGGANLYVDTRNYTYLHSSNTPWLYSTNWWMSSLTYNGCKVIGKTSPWQGVRQRIYVEAGKQYTFSAWVKASVATTIRSSVSSTVDDCTVTPTHDSFTFAIGTDWQRVSYTFTVTRAGNAEPTVQAQVNNVTLYICGIKFEEGNKATYWTENDEDLRTYTSAEVNILEGEINTKVSQTDFNALGDRVSAAESSISQTPSQITAAVNAVKVGGTNLFTGTKNFTDDGQWTRLAAWTITSNTYNDCVIAQKSVNWNCMSQKIWVEAGYEYTYSMWIKAASTQTVQWLFYRSETTNHCTVEGATTGMISGVGTTWQRISFTKTVATSGWAEPGIDVQNNGVTWYVCGIKFERGNKATDWSEAQGEVYAGTTVKITKDEFNVSTPKFGVDIVNSSEHFTLDSNGGTMDTLTVNKSLTASNIVYRYTGPANITIGSGGTYKSLQEFANAVNHRIVDKTVTATLTDNNYYESIEFTGISGGGRIIIVGAKNIVGQTRLVNNPIFLRFDNVTFIGRIYMLNVACVKFNACTFNGNGDGSASGVQQAFYMDYGCNAYCQTCGFYNAASLIYVDSGSRFESLDAKGGNCVNFILAYRCSIYMQGTRPSGNRVTYTVLSPNDPANLTIDYGSATPVVNPTTTTTINCKASKTAYDATHWHGDNRIRQGYYDMGSSGMNEQYGCFWFDTSALSGKTVKSALLTLTRISGYGRSSEVNVHLWTTPLTSASGNPTTNAVDHGVIGTIGNGETKQFTIPVAAISASANKGFMLRVDDGAVISGRSYSTNYAHYYGYGETTPPVLTVTYQ